MLTIIIAATDIWMMCQGVNGFGFAFYAVAMGCDTAMALALIRARTPR